jgi:hypothetical protein
MSHGESPLLMHPFYHFLDCCQAAKFQFDENKYKMKKIFTKANALMILAHLKDNAVRYAIASTIVSVLGLGAAETDKISNGINVGATMLSTLLTTMLG